MRRVGTMDTFGESGEDKELMAKYGLTANNIANNVLAIRSFSRKIIRERLNLKIFLDSANLGSDKKYYDIGLVDGITTNPTLLCQGGAGSAACHGRDCPD